MQINSSSRKCILCSFKTVRILTNQWLSCSGYGKAGRVTYPDNSRCRTISWSSAKWTRILSQKHSSRREIWKQFWMPSGVGNAENWSLGLWQKQSKLEANLELMQQPLYTTGNILICFLSQDTKQQSHRIGYHHGSSHGNHEETLRQFFMSKLCSAQKYGQLTSKQLSTP